ncbi:hypothetical protein Pelo_14984 [Pelomyxa schiedti]|nr:hypothetical protein Pelo_14984 [Pelomyxa schiedti]
MAATSVGTYRPCSVPEAIEAIRDLHEKQRTYYPWTPNTAQLGPRDLLLIGSRALAYLSQWGAFSPPASPSPFRPVDARTDWDLVGSKASVAAWLERCAARVDQLHISKGAPRLVDEGDFEGVLLVSCRLDGVHDVEVLVCTLLREQLECEAVPTGFDCCLPDGTPFSVASLLALCKIKLSHLVYNVNWKKHMLHFEAIKRHLSDRRLLDSYLFQVLNDYSWEYNPLCLVNKLIYGYAPTQRHWMSTNQLISESDLPALESKLLACPPDSQNGSETGNDLKVRDVIRTLSQGALDQQSFFSLSGNQQKAVALEIANQFSARSRVSFVEAVKALCTNKSFPPWFIATVIFSCSRLVSDAILLAPLTDEPRHVLKSVPLPSPSPTREEELLLFTQLPLETNWMILSFLGYKDILVCKQICRRWRVPFCNNGTWHRLYTNRWEIPHFPYQNATDWMFLYGVRCSVYEMNPIEGVSPSQSLVTQCREATRNLRTSTASSIAKLWHSLMELCTPADQVLPQSELEKFIPDWLVLSLQSANVFDIKTDGHIEGLQCSIAMYGTKENDKTVEHTELLLFLLCDRNGTSYYDLIEWTLTVTHPETGSTLAQLDSMSLRRFGSNKVSVYSDPALPNLLTTATSAELRPFTRRDHRGSSRDLFWGVFSRLPQGLVVSAVIHMLPRPERDNLVEFLHASPHTWTDAFDDAYGAH